MLFEVFDQLDFDSENNIVDEFESVYTAKDAVNLLFPKRYRPKTELHKTLEIKEVIECLTHRAKDLIFKVYDWSNESASDLVITSQNMDKGVRVSLYEVDIAKLNIEIDELIVLNEMRKSTIELLRSSVPVARVRLVGDSKFETLQPFDFVALFDKVSDLEIGRPDPLFWMAGYKFRTLKHLLSLKICNQTRRSNSFIIFEQMIENLPENLSNLIFEDLERKEILPILCKVSERLKSLRFIATDTNFQQSQVPSEIYSVIKNYGIFVDISIGTHKYSKWACSDEVHIILHLLRQQSRGDFNKVPLELCRLLSCVLFAIPTLED